jgi:hypothetical protein
VEESSTMWKFLKPLIRNVRTFWKKPFTREVRIFLIFLFISCFFWVLQSLQEVREVDILVPVTYSNTPLNVSITNPLPKTLTVTLRDKGTLLYYYYRHRKELALHVNVMNWYRKDDIGKVPSSIFEAWLRNKLQPSTQLLRVAPDTISIYFAEKSSKDVPVHLNSAITLGPQRLFSDTPRVQPSMVRLFAPASVLKHIRYVETEALILKKLNDSTLASIKLKPMEGVRFSASNVKVRLCVEEFTEQHFDIPVNGLHFPEGEVLLSFPPKVRVTFFVGLSAYKTTRPDQFELGVEYVRLLKSEKNVQSVLVVKTPANIQNLRIQPKNVECLIEKK